MLETLVLFAIASAPMEVEWPAWAASSPSSLLVYSFCSVPILKKKKNRRMSGWSVVRASCRPAARTMLRWVGNRTRLLQLYRSIAAKPSSQVRWPSTHRCGFFFDKKDFSPESPPVRRDRLIDPMGGVSTKLCATRILLLFLLLIYCTTLLYG